MSGMLDTSTEANWLLKTFERALDEIRTRVVDESEYHFGCFPLGWRPGNSMCRVYTSPVCVLCRALNTGTWRRDREDRETSGDEHYMFVIDGEVRFYKRPFQDGPRR